MGRGCFSVFLVCLLSGRPENWVKKNGTRPWQRSVFEIFDASLMFLFLQKARKKSSY
jgi:hypothetical protein